MKTVPAVALLGVLAVPLAPPATAASLTTEVDGVRVEVRSAPEAPVRARKTTYTVRLTDAAGVPITDGRLTLTGRMADGMTVVTPLRPADTPGVYRGEVMFTMEGLWDLAVRVRPRRTPLRVPAEGRGGAMNEHRLTVDVLTAPG